MRRLVGVVLVPLLGRLGGRVVVVVARARRLVAVHARGLHAAARQQLRQPRQRRQRAQRAQRARLAQQLRQRDGRRQRARRRARRRRARRARAARPFQVGLL